MFSTKCHSIGVIMKQQIQASLYYETGSTYKSWYIYKMDALLRNKIAIEFRIKVHTCSIHWLAFSVKQTQVIMTI